MANELPNPITRDEKYLAKAAGVEVDIPTPITREEKYLNAIAEGGGGSGFTPTETQLAAMNSGITATDVEQITTNKTNISSLSNGENITINSYNTEKYNLSNYGYKCRKVGNMIFCLINIKIEADSILTYDSAFSAAKGTVAKLNIPDNSVYESQTIYYDRKNQIDFKMSGTINSSGYVSISVYTNGTNYTLPANSVITGAFTVFCR